MTSVGLAIDIPAAQRLKDGERQLRKELATYQKTNKKAVEQEKKKLKERVVDFAHGVIVDSSLEQGRMQIRSKYVNKMRQAFFGSIIRRTAQSGDNMGKPISNLIDREEVNYFIEMSAEEKESFKQVIDRSRAAM